MACAGRGATAPRSQLACTDVCTARSHALRCGLLIPHRARCDLTAAAHQAVSGATYSVCCGTTGLPVHAVAMAGGAGQAFEVCSALFVPVNPTPVLFIIYLAKAWVLAMSWYCLLTRLLRD